MCVVDRWKIGVMIDGMVNGCMKWVAVDDVLSDDGGGA